MLPTLVKWVCGLWQAFWASRDAAVLILSIWRSTRSVFTSRDKATPGTCGTFTAQQLQGTRPRKLRDQRKKYVRYQSCLQLLCINKSNVTCLPENNVYGNDVKWTSVTSVVIRSFSIYTCLIYPKLNFLQSCFLYFKERKTGEAYMTGISWDC